MSLDDYIAPIWTVVGGIVGGVAGGLLIGGIAYSIEKNKPKASIYGKEVWDISEKISVGVAFFSGLTLGALLGATLGSKIDRQLGANLCMPQIEAFEPYANQAMALLSQYLPRQAQKLLS